MEANEPISVEVFSDVVCPWCYIGERRFGRALEILAGDADLPLVEHVLRPFQLDPGAPRGAGEPVLGYYARKFGGPERARQMADRVTAAAASEGLDFDLDRAVRANTADAHRLLWWAMHIAGVDVQLELNELLMRAYFTEGASLGDVDVLVDRAARCGLDAGAARAMLVEEEGLDALSVGLRRAAELGITAVPTFVVDGRWSIPGAQDPEVFVAAFRRLAAKRRDAEAS